MALEPTKHVNGRMWPPGVSGNPNGRPVGSRTVFSQGFLKDLASVWAERGCAAMEKTAIDQPGVFFATCARLIGPEVKLTIEQQLPGNLSPADWNLMMQILDAVKSAIPDAANRPAGEVLEFVLGALRNCPERRLIRSMQVAEWRNSQYLRISEWSSQVTKTGQLKRTVWRRPAQCRHGQPMPPAVPAIPDTG